jgi:putative ABC transport system substrate-binding protein
VARPGGNTTGVSMLGRQLDGKRLEVLHELAPGARKIGFVSDGTQAVRDELPKFEAAARRLGLSPSVLQVETVDAIAPGMASFAASGVDAVQFLASTFLQAARARCVAEATRLGLPAIYEWPETVEEGGLSSYGPRLTLCFRHIAVLVSKVLKGARPADLPIEQPTIYTLAINVGAARRIGFAVPEHMLLRADLLVD